MSDWRYLTRVFPEDGVPRTCGSCYQAVCQILLFTPPTASVVGTIVLTDGGGYTVPLVA
jgi:hypothetical protein